MLLALKAMPLYLPHLSAKALSALDLHSAHDEMVPLFSGIDHALPDRGLQVTSVTINSPNCSRAQSMFYVIMRHMALVSCGDTTYERPNTTNTALLPT